MAKDAKELCMWLAVQDWQDRLKGKTWIEDNNKRVQSTIFISKNRAKNCMKRLAQTR